MINHYELIGKNKIVDVLTDFYERAFQDPIIGHFFFEKDINHITNMQISFASAMLGGPDPYNGKPLVEAHENLNFRPPHFGRRQVLMREVLEKHGIPEKTLTHWLTMEQRLINVLRSQ